MAALFRCRMPFSKNVCTYSLRQQINCCQDDQNENEEKKYMQYSMVYNILSLDACSCSRYLLVHLYLSLSVSIWTKFTPKIKNVKCQFSSNFIVPYHLLLYLTKFGKIIIQWDLRQQ